MRQSEKRSEVILQGEGGKRRGYLHTLTLYTFHLPKILTGAV